MTKKKIIIIAILLAVVAVFAIGWSTLRGKMYDFNFTETTKQMESLSFEIKTPTKVPFKEMKVMDVKVKNNKQQAVISLFNVDKNMIDIRITKFKPEYAEDNKESVRLGNNLYGEFIPNHSGRRILTWKNDEIFYEIIYYAKLTPKEVSKTQLIKIAESLK